MEGKISPFSLYYICLLLFQLVLLLANQTHFLRVQKMVNTINMVYQFNRQSLPQDPVDFKKLQSLQIGLGSSSEKGSTDGYLIHLWSHFAV